jgi:hypothetical protein
MGRVEDFGVATDAGTREEGLARIARVHAISPEGVNTINLRSYGARVVNGHRVDLLAEMASKVYDIDPDEQPKWGHWHPSYTHPDGWVVDRVLYSDWSGFMASLYRGRGNQYVLSFRGSDPQIVDWMTDAAAAFGFRTNQYEWALKIAREVMDEHVRRPDRTTMTFTGHSLGGGLASCAAIMTGVVPCVTFNSAGLHEASRLWALKSRPSPPYGAERVCDRVTPTGEILAYHAQGEILTGAQMMFSGLVPVAVGESIELPMSENNWGMIGPLRHMMGVVMESLKEIEH